MTDDAELLRRYAEDRSEAAFAELVTRHLGFVYAAALRQLGGATHRAEEVTQTVFIDLARKAAVLSRRTELVGWLHTSTHYAAAKLKRGEQRRQRREEEAHTMQDMLSDSAAENHVEWDRLRPLLDDALHELDRRDREVLLMRFFQGRRFAEIGAKLRLGEDAARMRTERALEKLRGRLAQRSITSTTAALGIALASQPAIAVPAGLAASVTGVALAGVAAGAGIGGAAALSLFFMQTKTTVAAAIAVLALGFAVYELNSASREREAADVLARERDALQAQVRGLEQRVAITDEQNAVLQRDLQAARAQNPSFDRADFFEIVEVTRAQIETDQQADVRRLFGDAAGQALERYQATAGMRAIAKQLASALFSSEAPITPAQAEQLIEIMANHARGPNGRIEIGALNTGAALAQAQGLLNPFQLAELQRVATRVQEQAKAELERNTAPAASLKQAAK